MNDIEDLNELSLTIMKLISEYSPFYNGKVLIKKHEYFMEKLCGHIYRMGTLPTAQDYIKLLELLKGGE